jgi:phosphatidylglycerol lysyltransferase
MADQVATQEWHAHFRGKPMLKLLPVLAFVVFGAIFVRHILALYGAAVWAALTGLAAWQWALALMFTALSFMAIGTYDTLVHRVPHTSQSGRPARFAEIKAIALSQTLGFGALVRWRCLPELNVSSSLRLSAIISVTFSGALVVPLSGLVPRSASLTASGAAAIDALLLLARLAFRLG